MKKRTANPIADWDAGLTLRLTKAEVLALARGEIPQAVVDAIHKEAADLYRCMKGNGSFSVDETPTASAPEPLNHSAER